MSGTSKQPPRTQRVRIERLVLDLRGVSPEAARSAVRALGPELTRALAGREVTSTSATRIDAGRIANPKSPSAPQLATQMAQHIARSVSTSKGRRS